MCAGPGLGVKQGDYSQAHTMYSQHLEDEDLLKSFTLSALLALPYSWLCLQSSNPVQPFLAGALGEFFNLTYKIDNLMLTPQNSSEDKMRYNKQDVK